MPSSPKSSRVSGVYLNPESHMWRTLQIHYPPLCSLRIKLNCSPISQTSPEIAVSRVVILTPEKTQAALKQTSQTSQTTQNREQIANLSLSSQLTPRSTPRSQATFSTGLRQNGYLNSSFRRSTARSQSFRSRPFSAGNKGLLLQFLFHDFQVQFYSKKSFW